MIMGGAARFSHEAPPARRRPESRWELRGRPALRTGSGFGGFGGTGKAEKALSGRRWIRLRLINRKWHIIAWAEKLHGKRIEKMKIKIILGRILGLCNGRSSYAFIQALADTLKAKIFANGIFVEGTYNYWRYIIWGRWLCLSEKCLMQKSEKMF